MGRKVFTSKDLKNSEKFKNLFDTIILWGLQMIL